MWSVDPLLNQHPIGAVYLSRKHSLEASKRFVSDYSYCTIKLNGALEGLWA